MWRVICLIFSDNIILHKFYSFLLGIFFPLSTKKNAKFNIFFFILTSLSFIDLDKWGLFYFLNFLALNKSTICFIDFFVPAKNNNNNKKKTFFLENLGHFPMEYFTCSEITYKLIVLLLKYKFWKKKTSLKVNHWKWR